MSFIYKILAYPLGYIMKGCYWLVTDALHLPIAYVFALFLFTFVTKLLMFPLSVKQHKATAKMAAFNPMIQDIQTRYKNDRERMNEEMTRIQLEYGYDPTSGCLPMVLNLLIMFGLVEVIYCPLTYMLTLPSELISGLNAITASMEGIDVSNRMIETYTINLVKTNPSLFSEYSATYAAEMDKISSLQMSIGKINLYEKPELALSLALIIPLLSIITQIISTVVSTKSTGTQDGAAAQSMRSMLIMTSIMYAVFSFMYPLGFSLYWAFQNLLNMFQSWLLKKMYDPEKIKEDLMQAIKNKKKEKNARKKVTYLEKDSGKVVEKEMSSSDADRLRLQRAREINQERYGDE